MTTAADPRLRVSVWDQPHHTHPHSPTGTGSGGRRPGKCSPLPWDLHRQRPDGGRESEGEKVPGEKMWVPEGGWGWGGGLGEQVRSMGPSWTRGKRRERRVDGDGKTQKRLRRGEGRRGGKGERCGEAFTLGLQEVFIKPQKWVGNRRADRWRDETDRKTQQGSKRQQTRDPQTEKMWPAAQAADIGVGDAVRPGGRQGLRPRATWEDTGVESSKRPKGKRSFLFSLPRGPGETRWDAGGDRGGRGKEIQEGEWTPAPPTHLPPGWGRDHCPAGRPGGRGVKGEGQGRGPESRFQRAPTYCAASRVSMVVLAAACSHHPYLYLGPAPGVGGAGVPAGCELSPPRKSPQGGGRGGGWIAQPLGHVARRVGPGAAWIWGSPGLGWGGWP